MHTLTVRTKFTFGDRVRFDSPTQQASGTGAIVAITVGPDNQIDYLIDPGEGYLYGGIMENEITLIGGEES